MGVVDIPPQFHQIEGIHHNAIHQFPVPTVVDAHHVPAVMLFNQSHQFAIGRELAAFGCAEFGGTDDADGFGGEVVDAAFVEELGKYEQWK